MSFMHLAILFDSPAVVDLKAAASSPEMRLKKIAERVGMEAHIKTKPFLDLAAPFSVLMQQIETGTFNQAPGATALYFPPAPANPVAQNAEDVIDQYSLATGRDLKAPSVSVTTRATAAASLPKGYVPSLAPKRPNGAALQLPAAARQGG